MAYVVTCTHCKTTVVTAMQLGDPEAAAMLRHLSDLHPQLVQQSQSFRDLLKHFSVRSV